MLSFHHSWNYFTDFTSNCHVLGPPIETHLTENVVVCTVQFTTALTRKTDNEDARDEEKAGGRPGNM